MPSTGLAFRRRPMLLGRTDGRPGPPRAKETVPAAAELPPVPECFLCPLSGQIMIDPVDALDGRTYDRAALEARACQDDGMDELGRQAYLGPLRPNDALRAAVAGYLELRRAIEQGSEPAAGHGTVRKVERAHSHEKSPVRALTLASARAKWDIEAADPAPLVTARGRGGVTSRGEGGAASARRVPKLHTHLVTDYGPPTGSVPFSAGRAPRPTCSSSRCAGSSADHDVGSAALNSHRSAPTYGSNGRVVECRATSWLVAMTPRRITPRRVPWPPRASV